ncbi:GFA family protein [Phyllobacterium sp. CL33Tsu]|uniref:GFA family protein n=1 Tax=Phyllobacterium sp. CL33Tsu TaxID=1798191 RepID=UPI000B886E52|nr:GFA family protein [Phyllobacterium sp. CL33Tsu]
MVLDEIEGGCLCGNIRFRVRRIRRTHICHCDMCRRATGGPFAVLSWVDATAVVWEGTKQPKARRSSPIATRSFCGDCGTPITLQYDDDPDQLAFYAGTFDTPEKIPPTYNYHEQSRLHWVRCGEELPAHPPEEGW